MPNIRVDEEVYRQLLKIAAELEAKEGRRVSINEATKEALRRAKERDRR